MGKKIRVQLHGLQNRGVKIDSAATEGAIVGSNLFWPDGTLVTADQFTDAMQAGTAYDEGTIGGGGGETASSVQLTLWSLILNIPAIIKSIVDLTGDGWMRKDGDVASVSKHLWTKNQVDTGEDVTIPSGSQMLVWEEFVFDGGSLTPEGELVIIDNQPQQTVKTNFRVETSNYTITGDDHVVQAGAAGLTFTLPTAVGRTGAEYICKNYSSGNLTIDGDGTETIDGNLTVVLALAYESVSVVSDGTNWSIV